MQGQQSSQVSFFGMIYEELIPADHLLRRLSSMVGLLCVGPLVSDCYCPDNGRPDPRLRRGYPGPGGALQSCIIAISVWSFRPPDRRPSEPAFGVQMASGKQGGKFAAAGIFISWGILVASLLDAIENYALWRILVGGTAEIYPHVAAFSATVKFFLIFVGIGFALVGWLWPKRIK